MDAFRMDVPHLVVQIVIAIVCAGIANILVPRTIPGKLAGLILIGLTGVWFGEWGYWLIRQEFGIDHPLLSWQIQGVLILPAVLGSAVILYTITAILKWWKYGV
ncbi:MAG TPA: hypothetical protein V6C78_23385 [Crinalium sp.]|jgi:uncharacterized membrane protein YeaQ/YmgE (transglycosylase-associated protein family)